MPPDRGAPHAGFAGNRDVPALQYKTNTIPARQRATPHGWRAACMRPLQTKGNAIPTVTKWRKVLDGTGQDPPKTQHNTIQTVPGQPRLYTIPQTQFFERPQAAVLHHFSFLFLIFNFLRFFIVRKDFFHARYRQDPCHQRRTRPPARPALGAAKRARRRPVFLGDGLYDLDTALELRKTPLPCPVYRVRGNCDVGYPDPAEGLAPFAGVLFFYTHGHHYGVKMGRRPPGRDRRRARRRRGAVRPHPCAGTAARRRRGGRCVQPRQSARRAQLRRRDGGPTACANLDGSGCRNFERERAVPARNREHQRLGQTKPRQIRAHRRGVHTCQTAGRGRLGRGWANAPGQALYYTAVLKTPLAQPGTLPLFASLAVADTLRQRYGVPARSNGPTTCCWAAKKLPASCARSRPTAARCWRAWG